MSNYPDPDSFTDIVAVQHEDDFTLWRVVGVTVDWDAVKQLNIETGIPNKQLAEAFVRWYTDKYWSDRFSAEQGC
jgi:hypothetical protein